MTDQESAGLVNLNKNFKFLSTPIFRASYRGLKRCPGCGLFNGVRSILCRNKSCKLRKEMISLQIPLQPIRLQSFDNSKVLYSIRSKEQNANPRNFVMSTVPQEICKLHSFVCYTCGISGNANTRLCKHIDVCTTKTSMPQAEVFPILRDVLWNLNGLDEEQKQRLWTIYQQEEESVPAVQRISSSMFVVRCIESKVFPAGRLHVMAISNGVSTKKGIYSCACKKLKIIVEQDNSVVMQDEVCDHILLVLAAVLSNRKGKTAYGNFTSALKSYWMPINIETPIVDSTQEDALFGLSIGIGGNFDIERSENEQTDDIFIYNNDFMSDENIPDFDDIILNGPSNAVAPLSTDIAISANTSLTNSNDILHPGDPNLGLTFTIKAEDMDNKALYNETPPINALKTESNNMTTAHLEFSDCKIELMDQFELTDQIDLSTTEDIKLEGEQTWLENGISILEAPVVNTTESGSSTHCNDIASVLNIPTKTHPTTYYNNNSNSVLKTNQIVEALPIELPSIAMVKKCPVKASELVDEVNTRKFPPIPAKRMLIINESNKSKQQHWQQTNNEVLNTEEPSLAFSAWLDYVIEVINDSVASLEERNVEHTFHVHEEIFAHFSKSFSNGIKLRIPNSTTVIKSGKYKGLIKYVWYFSNSSTVKRIFTTKNLSLETERVFEINCDGISVPYVRQIAVPVVNGKHKRIYPKLSLFKAFICFESGSAENINNFKLEWLPNAFPKSNHGILKLQFSVGIHDPQEIQTSIQTRR